MAQRARIDGIYELGHVLYALDAGIHGFARSDIDGVECFWHSGDMHRSAAGFLLRLCDGRRVHVDFLHWHGFEQDEDFRIQVEMLASDRPPPTPPEPCPPDAWTSDTAHLDRMLAADRT